MVVPGPLRPLSDYLRNAWHERAVALKAISFAMVGVVNATVDASIFFLAYLFVTRSLLVANVLSWIVAVTGSYILNSYITFAAESGRQLRFAAYGAFVIAGLAGLSASTAALLLGVHYAGWPVWLAKGCALVASFAVNFSLSHFVVFRRRAG